MTSGDAALLGELRDMWTTYDPPPPGLVATMIAAVAAAEIDEEWEMLVLLRDSADATIWISHDPEDWAEFKHAPNCFE